MSLKDFFTVFAIIILLDIGFTIASNVYTSDKINKNNNLKSAELNPGDSLKIRNESNSIIEIFIK